MPVKNIFIKNISWKKGDIHQRHITFDDENVNVSVKIIHGDPYDVPKVLMDMISAVNYQKHGSQCSQYEFEITWKGQTADEIEEEVTSYLKNSMQ